jgi:dTMP kinase
MGLFITFEGGEGCGKSTQAKALFQRLVKSSIPTILVHEPGGTPLGERVRNILKRLQDIPISPLTELMLFNASRSQLISDIIQPALQQNQVVVCDRFMDSTVAYQHYGRGLDLAIVKEVNRIASQGLTPDLTFLLDIAPEVGLARKSDGATDRFMQEDLDFHRRIKEGFIRMACEEHRRWLMIDATLPRKQIGNMVWDRVCLRLGKKEVQDRETLSQQIQFPYDNPPKV